MSANTLYGTYVGPGTNGTYYKMMYYVEVLYSMNMYLGTV